jgi:hypothetical protein
VTSQSTSFSADPAFPGVTPVQTIQHLTTKSDAEGRYSFTFEANGNQGMFISLGEGRYVQSPGPNIYSATEGSVIYHVNNGQLYATDLNGNPVNWIELYRKFYDTIFVELPAYIKDEIRNTGDQYGDDALFIKTPYTQKLIREGNTPGAYNPDFNWRNFNWCFVGPNVNRTIIETIPGQSAPQVEIEWLYKRAQDITIRKETISLVPESVTEYVIQY